MTLADRNKIDFVFCDYNLPVHVTAFTDLLNSYMRDPMGEAPVLDNKQQQKLVEGLANHASAFVLFILYEGKYAGFTTCFVNFSTFKVKSYLYVHDVFVLNNFRSKGLGKCLMQKLIIISKERDYCKITLEVREDNKTGKKLYQSLGFGECDPKMFFWTKTL